MLTNKLAISLSLLAISVAACKKKDDGGGGGEPAPPAAPGGPSKPAAPADTPAAKPAAAAPLAEADLSPFGADFQGWIAMAPAGSKIEFDDPSRHIKISDEDFISVSDAPYWQDGVNGLKTDPSNLDIKKVSDTEYRWTRNPPLGKSWAFDVLVKVGDKQFSCNGETFTSGEMADKMVEICKSSKKK